MPEEIVKELKNTINILEWRLNVNYMNNNINITEYTKKLIMICKYIIDNDLAPFVGRYLAVYAKYKKVLSNPNLVDITALETVKKSIDDLETELDMKNIKNDRVVDDSIENEIKPVRNTRTEEIKTYKLINYFNTKMQDLHFLGDELVTSKSNWNKEELKKLSDMYADIYSLVKEFGELIPNVGKLNGADAENIEQLTDEENNVIKNVILNLDNFIKIIRLINKKGLNDITEEDLQKLELVYTNLENTISSYPKKNTNIQI